MKLTLSWLKEYLDTNATLDEITRTLTSLGLEVESVEDKSQTLAAFRVAQILEAKPHPDAEKLRVCQVDTGAERLQIVCGAPNARPGINVVLAPVGSVIPTNGMTIKASKIRGVESNGMLCSAAELGLGEDHSGIIEMPACNDNLAQQYVQVAGLNDPVIEIAITPNRGDCLGIYGVARDLAAAGLGTLKPLPTASTKGSYASPLSIRIEDEKECPLFIGRYFKNVKNSPSPQWLQQRLKAIGLRPISALVDITNYIAFAFARPLHVYDAKKLQGGLMVRRAKTGETITALDDKKYTLTEPMTVIADQNTPQAIAGIIGGAASGCDENTTDVLLEVALFDPISVSATGRKLDILTDSRYRFERRVDPGFMHKAAEITTQMILELCGGEASELVIAGKEPQWQREIEFNTAYVAERGGVDISEKDSKRILEALGFTFKGNKVSVPSWRPDVEGAADLVEEILRIRGYDNIPTSPLPHWHRPAHSLVKPSQGRVSSARYALANRGMTEVITWSFMKSDKAALFGGGKAALNLLNPISSDLDAMRPSILPNLLDAVRRNNDRGIDRLSLFEIGLIYENATPQGQHPACAGIRAGKTSAKEVHGTCRDVDVFDAKADCLAALEAAGAPIDNLRVTTDAPAWYHPGRSGVLRLGKTALATFGDIHPGMLKTLDVKGPVVGFELLFNAIPAAKPKKSTAKPKLELSEYQSSTRDFAFLIDAKVPAEDILRVAKTSDKTLIESAALFDVYQGKGVPEGKKSVALSVTIRAADHTLTESELDGISKKVIQAVTGLGGELRG